MCKEQKDVLHNVMWYVIWEKIQNDNELENNFWSKKEMSWGERVCYFRDFTPATVCQSSRDPHDYLPGHVSIKGFHKLGNLKP